MLFPQGFRETLPFCCGVDFSILRRKLLKAAVASHADVLKLIDRTRVKIEGGEETRSHLSTRLET